MTAKPISSQPAFALAEGSALSGGIAFVDGVAAGWARPELLEWMHAHLISPGRMGAITTLSEAAVGSIALDPTTRATGPRVASLSDLPKLLAMARSRVVVSMRAFIAAQPDDRFLKAAIYADRVQRVKGEGGRNVWVARPHPRDFLSDIVLSLFAVDVLMQREFHEKNLCVCEVCGRISFQPEVTTRAACANHPTKSESQSGFHVSGANWKLDPKR